MGVTYINPYRFAAFSPLDLSPSLWLDASDATTITASGSPAKVSQWNDKSGNGRNFSQAVSASQPTTGTRTVNGLNGLDFANNRLTNSSTNIVSQTDGTFTVFAVALSDSTSGFRGILNGDQGSGTPRGAQFLRQNGTSIEAVRVSPFSGAGGFVTATKTSALTAGTASLVRAVLDTANLQMAANSVTGTAVACTGGATATATTHEVGAISGGFLWDGIICEIVAYPKSLTSGEIASVETYLKAKWGTP